MASRIEEAVADAAEYSRSMTSIQHLTLEVSDTAAASRFYADAFGLGELIRLRASDAPTSGFRGFTISLIAGQPSTVDSLIDSAVSAGATTLKAAAKSMWGYGGALQAPDGAIWTIATSSKKEIGPATRTVDQVVVLLGAADVADSKRFYVEHGVPVDKSFGKYVQFALPSSPIGLALYGRRALAKHAGVPEEGSGSHRLVFGTDAGGFTDPDGFVWETAS